MFFLFDVRLTKRFLKIILPNRKYEIRYAMEGEVHGRETKKTVTGYQGVFLLVPAFSRWRNYRIQFLRISVHACIVPYIISEISQFSFDICETTGIFLRLE